MRVAARHGETVKRCGRIHPRMEISKMKIMLNTDLKFDGQNRCLTLWEKGSKETNNKRYKLGHSQLRLQSPRTPFWPAVREPCRDKPCSARAHAQRSARATHVLQDDDEADADERGDTAAAMPARSGEGRPLDPSRGCSAKHA